MKNFVETFQDSIDMTDDSTTIWESDFKRIQLDALKEGMRRAANECTRIGTLNGSAWWEDITIGEIRTAILSAAEKITEKDL